VLEERSRLTVFKHDLHERQDTTYTQINETGFLRQLLAFKDSVVNGTEVISNLAGVRKDLAVLQAITRSIIVISVQSCLKLCMGTRGRVYTQEMGVKNPDCWLRTRQRDITKLKLMSTHSNATHDLILSRGTDAQQRVNGVWLNKDDSSSRRGRKGSPSREWNILPLDSSELNIFRTNDIPVMTRPQSWSQKHCVLQQRQREKKQQKISRYCEKHQIQDWQICAEEFQCLKKRYDDAAEQSKLKGNRPTCTQEERDVMYGSGWRWNTRNCGSLGPALAGECLREKRWRAEIKTREQGSSKKNIIVCI
ncbi:MAG: hypothetical protein AN484_26165, partial [Aphanizomenon flos-aquae WA102]